MYHFIDLGAFLAFGECSWHTFAALCYIHKSLQFGQLEVLINKCSLTILILKSLSVQKGTRKMKLFQNNSVMAAS